MCFLPCIAYVLDSAIVDYQLYNNKQMHIEKLVSSRD